MHNDLNSKTSDNNKHKTTEEKLWNQKNWQVKPVCIIHSHWFFFKIYFKFTNDQLDHAYPS